jgi:hypothetical protein
VPGALIEGTVLAVMVFFVSLSNNVRKAFLNREA